MLDVARFPTLIINAGSHFGGAERFGDGCVGLACCFVAELQIMQSIDRQFLKYVSAPRHLFFFFLAGLYELKAGEREPG